ncbi:MAG: U32 family peptidase, partial [Burkholderiaceae bacterium]
MLQSHQLELLAPARTADIGIEAVNHGADAVYIGGPSFGARANASNELKDIERLVKHAHRFHSRIFVTLNTILRDDELPLAEKLAWQLHGIGVDAMIVQDMGFLELVLAPELTLPQIREIHAALDPQRAAVEFFVHGALCVAYSGQCFISHAHTGRSAN